MKQNFEQKNTTFHEFYNECVTVSNQMPNVHEQYTALYLQLSSITLEVSVQLMLHFI